MDTATSAQQAIYARVGQRGYVDGWTPPEFFARNIAKLIEEAAELSLAVMVDGDLQVAFVDQLDTLARLARVAFKDKAGWKGACWFDENTGVARGELADVQVVVACMGQTLANEPGGEGYDTIAAALDKSQADVARGVR